jgi:hypothetical protein
MIDASLTRLWAISACEMAHVGPIHVTTAWTAIVIDAAARVCGRIVSLKILEMLADPSLGFADVIETLNRDVLHEDDLVVLVEFGQSIAWLAGRDVPHRHWLATVRAPLDLESSQARQEFE